METVEAFAERARTWLGAHAPRRGAPEERPDGGAFDVAVFKNHTEAEERALLERAATWRQEKAEHGFHAIAWPREYGGLGLTPAHDRAFTREERRFAVPADHEVLSITVKLIAPTIARHGTPEQQRRFVPPLLRTDFLCCQLFSEPTAGSDLAGLACKAVRDGDSWVITGQKVWTSGAKFAAYAEILCRTDYQAPKHEGITAFLVPMDSPGIEVRPIRQMTGGASFNEVFLDEVRIPDKLRLGGVGEGWRVALTTLGFERAAAGSGQGRVGGSWEQVLASARQLGATSDPVIRQALSDLYIHYRLLGLNARRAAARSGPPGPEGSIGKLFWTIGMARMSDVVTSLLGPRLAADTGEWGTFGWGEHVLGAPGYRIAGGSDEIQRTVIAERVLGLPREPNPT